MAVFPGGFIRNSHDHCIAYKQGEPFSYRARVSAYTKVVAG